MDIHHQRYVYSCVGSDDDQGVYLYKIPEQLLNLLTLSPFKVYWRRQDNAPLPKNEQGVQSSILAGNVLSFANVTKDHRGTYYCVATNVVGQGARRNVDVEGMII